MRGDFGIGVEGISKEMNLGNLFRSAGAFGAGFVFTVNAAFNPKRAASDTSDAPDLAAAERGGGARRMSGPQGT